MQRIKRWFLAVPVMADIYALSSRPASELPSFGRADAVMNKGADM